MEHGIPQRRAGVLKHINPALDEPPFDQMIAELAQADWTPVFCAWGGSKRMGPFFWYPPGVRHGNMKDGFIGPAAAWREMHARIEGE